MKEKPKGTIKRMITNVAKKDKSVFILCAVFTLLGVITPFLPVLLPKLIIAEISMANPSWERVIMIAAGFFVIAGALGFAKTIVNGIAYPRITALRIDYLCDVSKKLMTMDYPYIEDSKFWENNQQALQACSSNNNGIEGIYHKLFDMTTSILLIIGLSVFIGLRCFLILPALAINVAATFFVAMLLNKYSYKRRDDIAHHTRRVQYCCSAAQDFAYGKDTRLYGLKERVKENINTEIRGYMNVWRAIKNREFALGFITLLTLLISDLATYGLLTYYVFNGMSIADFSMYIAAVTTLSLYMKTISEQLSVINKEKPYVDDFYAFLNAEYYTDEGKKTAVPRGDTLEIEFKDVSFKYPRTDRYIFRNLNLKIPKGQRLAVVGVNGAGKSTLVKLLMGLFMADEGEILINGVNVNDYKKSELYSMFAVVFQDINIWAFPLSVNVACKLDNIDKSRVNAVIDRVGLRKRVDTLKNGTEHMMLKVIEDDGAQFSGGENQKLAIARALYKDGNMVIMDEPTAALDALAEAEIYSEFSDLVAGKTALYISHRLASTKFCDKIAFFDGEKIAEYGTHDELMSKHGKYYEMFTIQGKYYQEGSEQV